MVTSDDEIVLFSAGHFVRRLTREKVLNVGHRTRTRKTTESNDGVTPRDHSVVFNKETVLVGARWKD